MSAMKSTAAVTPANISYGKVPSSNLSGTCSVDGNNLSGCKVSNSAGEAVITPR